MPDPADNSMPGEIPELSGALRIGPYLLGRRLGEGGMGAVYLARDEALDRNVAIKILRVPRPVSEEVIQRFTREAKAAARLNHPNTVTIHQFGQANGQLYLVMEHIEGGSLADELQSHGKLPWPAAARAIRDAACGLAAAHEAGLVHRDIKPSNLMRTRRGDIKVVDFGLARIREGGGEITLAGSVLGTPQYMAPEQCSHGAFDVRSDIYALTCTFYALLTGSAPFQGELDEILRGHIDKPFPDPRQAVPDLPPSICAILDRGGRKAPGERFQNAGELMEAIDAALSEAKENGTEAAASTCIVPPLARRPIPTPAGFAGAPPQPAREAMPPSLSPSLYIPNNIPSEVTTFIGRTRELADALRLLDQMRVVTLFGPGGTGKTRLGLRIATEILSRSPMKYSDGVWFVELASLSEGALVPQAVAQVVAVREAAGRPLMQTLCQSLGSQRVLILLDNCEHVIEPCAKLAEALIRCGPGVSILATSREALGLPGEAILPIPPLSLPDTQLIQTLDSDEAAAGRVLGFDAVRLFVDRAAAIAHSFQLTSAAAPHVARICRELDGIPLAIELAAARVGALGVEQIAERLQDRFRLLTRGSRTALPRQRTLRALIDWSYDLLADDERRLFAALCVFAGGWSLEAAEAVGSEAGAGDAAVLDLLAQLLGKSLLAADDAPAGGKRYRMLETVRHYAAEKLAESGTEAAVRDRHLEFFLQMAETAEQNLVGPSGPQWSQRLEVEHDNLRAAMDWARRRPADGGAGLRLAGALHRFWVRRGYLVEGRRRLEDLLAREDGGAVEPRVRAKALVAAGRVAGVQWDSAQVEKFAGEAMSLYQQAGDAEGIIQALSLSAHAAILTGDYRRGDALLLEVMQRVRRLSLRTMIAETAYNLGLVAHYQGENFLARERMTQAMAYARELQDPRHIAIVSLGWAFVLTFGGQPDDGTALCLEALKTFEALGDIHRIANSYVLLAFSAVWRGDVADACDWCNRCLKTLANMNDRGVSGMALLLLGQLTARQGDAAHGFELCEQSLALSREAQDNRGIAWALAVQGWIAARRGNPEQALALYTEALLLAQRLPDWRTAAQCIEGLAALEASQNRPERAGQFWDCAAAIRKRIGCPLSPPERLDLHPFGAPAQDPPGIELSDAGGPPRELPPLTDSVQAAVALLQGKT